LATSDLHEAEFSVLLLLVSELDMDNLIAINQSELATIIGMKRPNFSRAIKKLRLFTT
jgi:DNA-binding MarR family transcriptional regulator